MRKYAIILLALCLCLLNILTISVKASDLGYDDEEQLFNDDPVVQVNASGEVDLGITAEAVMLMEATTGTVLYEKQADERLSPASITKIMTLLLIFEALEDKKITLEEEVTVSEYAQSMGGSQVFLEAGEKQTVETMIKCIIVASGNDASVAMAEHLAGSEAEFVAMMNQRAKDLGMENTNFEDCCGLTESDNHYTTARDVAIMSRELSVQHPAVHNYSTIWMEDIVHSTNRGTSDFTLANTNKLLRQYDGCTGLKTGSTSIAKYCLSATASRSGIDLIAVVLAAPESATRFNEAATLLNYGFATTQVYKDEAPGGPDPVTVKGGVIDKVPCEYPGYFQYVATNGESIDNIEKQWHYDEDVKAPIEKGQQVGKLVYVLDGQVIGEIPILASEEVKKASFLDIYTKMWKELFKIN